MGPPWLPATSDTVTLGVQTPAVSLTAVDHLPSAPTGTASLTETSVAPSRPPTTLTLTKEPGAALPEMVGAILEVRPSTLETPVSLAASSATVTLATSGALVSTVNFVPFIGVSLTPATPKVWIVGV